MAAYGHPVFYSYIMKNLKKSLLTACMAFAALTPEMYAANRMDSFIDSLLNEMTLEEKIGQLNLPVSGILTGDARSENVAGKIRNGLTGGVFGVVGADECRKMQRIAVEESRHGIPLIFGLDVIHGLETTFPIPLAQAATWNPDIVERGAKAAAREAGASGICWTFSPMVDVTREPRWGRVAEGAGEDPWLGSRMAEAMVKGYQGDDLTDPATVLACVKHFALYGAPEGGRDYNTVIMDRQTAMNEYLPPYKAAIDAGVGSLMASFNEFEGIPITANRYLLTDLLRDKWNFNGFVVSDYTAIPEMVSHGIGDFEECTLRAFDAGIDMDMVSEGFVKYLGEAVKQGRIKESDINAAAKRILEAKYKLGLFDDPYRYCDSNREKTMVNTADDRKLARELGAESMVLLKNEGKLLPLINDGRKIALIGPLADAPWEMPGMWNVAQSKAHNTSLLEGMRKIYGDNVKYAKGCNALEDASLEKKVSGDWKLHRDGRDDLTMRDEALKLASESDVIVLAMGELMNMSGEGAARADIRIPEPQRSLIKELTALDKPVVLVLFTGRPLVLTEDIKDIDAVLNVWFAGSEAGDAIAGVLSGEYEPSGRLPISFPYHIGQIPVHYNQKMSGRPMPDGRPYQKYRNSYMDIPNAPLYPFGYGLGYTDFTYGEISLSSPEMGLDGEVTASVTVSNIGDREGSEVVQLYIRDIAASSTRPVKELRGFEKITLAPGESKTVNFVIDANTLGFYNHDLEYVCEPGEFDIMIGRNSSDTKSVRLKAN